MPDPLVSHKGSQPASFSIIVPVRNVQATIQRTIKSILNQKWHKTPEIILVDGASTDGTLEAIAPFESKIGKVISEPDDGLYDAINKGIALASGDVIGILNGDDLYAHQNVLSLYDEAFRDPEIDLVYADLVFFSASQPHRVRRFYSSQQFHPKKLRVGWMPPHPTVFLRSTAYERVGYYRTDYQIAADYEFLIRAFLIHGLSYRRIASVVVRMQLGGLSTSGLKATYTLNREIIRACKDNGIHTSWPRILMKYPAKLRELLIQN